MRSDPLPPIILEFCPLQIPNKLLQKFYIQNIKQKQINGVKAFVKNCFKVSKIKHKSLIRVPFINLIAKIYYLICKRQQILLILEDIL